MSARGGSAQGPAKSVYVYTLEDGVEQKYKLVVRGDLRQLGTLKIKKYLEKASGVPAAAQQLVLDDRILADTWDGADIGLFDGAQLFMQAAADVDQPQVALSTGNSSRHTRSPRGGNGNGNGTTSARVAAQHQPQRELRPATSTGRAERQVTSRCLDYQDEDVQRSQQRSHSPAWHTAASSVARSSHGRVGSTRFSTCNDEDEEGAAGRGRLASPSVPAVYSRDSDVDDGRGPRRSGSSSAVQRTSEYERWGGTTRNTALLSGRPSRSFSARGSTATTARTSLSQRDPRMSVLAAENDAMQRENALLREKLLEVERRATQSTADWQLQEEIEELQDALLQKEEETEEAVAEAIAGARAKEEELVRELDLLREERRRLRKEQEMAEMASRDEIGALRAQLQAQKADLQERDEMIQQLRIALAQQRPNSQPRGGLTAFSSPNASVVRTKSVEPSRELDELVQDALDRLSAVFNAGYLSLDANNTCVIEADTDDLTSNETVNLLITLDGATERLYMYATVLSALPHHDDARLQLYERLLEGALLGKDMSGAGVGVSTENGLVLMSTSVDVRRSDPGALAAQARPFVTSVMGWKAEAERIGGCSPVQ